MSRHRRTQTESGARALGEISVVVGFDQRKGSGSAPGWPSPGLERPKQGPSFSSLSASYTFLTHNFICGLREPLMQTEDAV